MLYSKYLSLLILSCLFFSKLTTVHGLIDPITGTLAVGAFITGYFLHKTNYSIPFIGSSCPNKMDINSKFNPKFIKPIKSFFLGRNRVNKSLWWQIRSN